MFAGITEKQLTKVLDEAKNTPLSGDDLQRICPGKVILVRDLPKYKNIDELLGDELSCYLLYEINEPNVGHWCCLSRHGNIVEFFDPYSGKPDSQLEYIDDDFASVTGQDQRRLTHMLIDCEYDVAYNEFGFQRFDNKTKNCGRWVGMRCLLKDMPLGDFNQLFLENYEDGGSDYIATLVTLGMVK